MLAHNYRTAHGEIDIIASRAAVLTFVEFKTRSSHTFTDMEDSLTRSKQAHMPSAASYYLQVHPKSGESWLFDVIAQRA